MRVGSFENSPRRMLAVGIVFCVVGPGMLIGAGYLYMRTKAFLAKATRTTGEVVKLEKRRSSDDGARRSGGSRYTYAPVYTYTDHTGKQHRVTSSSSSNPPSYDVGDEVGVLYDPDDPSDSSIDSFFPLWGATAILSGMGLVFAAIGGALLAGWFIKGRNA